MDRLITRKEAIENYGVSKAQINNWIRRKWLPEIKRSQATGGIESIFSEKQLIKIINHVRRRNIYK